MAFFDQHGSGYLGWAWDTYNCNSFPALISAYDGTPTQFGVGLRDHLASVAGASLSSPVPTTTTTSTLTRGARRGLGGSTRSASAHPARRVRASTTSIARRT